MFNQGRLEYGVYGDNDELDGVNPEIIARYYSVDKPYTFGDAEMSGAGHSDNGVCSVIFGLH